MISRLTSALVAIFFSLHVKVADAETLLEATQFTGLTIGKGFSEYVEGVSGGSYELESGKIQTFEGWYGRKSIDFDLHLTTKIEENLWLHWGFSTGEYGEKYRIEPSFSLGFERVVPLQDGWAFWFKFKAKLGGYLRESPCTATYTLAEGPQQVNCRLAASVLAPEATLQYLWQKRPTDQIMASALFVWVF